MTYILTKEKLQASAYYCAAGVDLHPILRFGDVIYDFVYVTAGLKREEFLGGLNLFLKSVDDILKNSKVKIEISYTKDISINDIEHSTADRLISRMPDYFNDYQYQQYLNSMKPFFHHKDLNIEIGLKLTINSIERNIRLFHLGGEAIATYDQIYRQQGIAPKLFISIQSGLIEFPANFSDTMFRQSVSKPKVWLRGIWAAQELTYNLRVFEPFGLFNERIGEFRQWQVDLLEETENLSNSNFPLREVVAYGQACEWQNMEIYKLEKEGLKINKLLQRHNRSMEVNYHKTIYMPLTKIYEIEQLAAVLIAENNYLTNINIAILPCWLECCEICLDDFYQNYQPNNNYTIEIDIFYANKLDLYRL